MARLRDSPEPQADGFADHHCPLFVTFNTLCDRGGEPMLRGCIGSLEPLRLRRGLGDFALRSAFGDRRFPPIEEHELHTLSCTVSLLCDYEVGLHAHDWVVGTHGIIIEFKDPHGTRRSATYLPEVAREQGWDQREAVVSLVRKAGYNGAVNQSLLDSVKLTRYQSSKCSMSFQEYRGATAAAPVKVSAR